MHARLHVSMCSSYDLCHPDTHMDRQHLTSLYGKLSKLSQQGWQVFDAGWKRFFPQKRTIRTKNSFLPAKTFFQQLAKNNSHSVEIIFKLQKQVRNIVLNVIVANIAFLDYIIQVYMMQLPANINNILKYSSLLTKRDTNTGVFACVYHSFYQFFHCLEKNSFCRGKNPTL